MNITLIPEEKLNYPHIVDKLRKEYNFDQIVSDVGSSFSHDFLLSDDRDKNPVDTFYIPLYQGFVKEELIGPAFPDF